MIIIFATPQYILESYNYKISTMKILQILIVIALFVAIKGKMVYMTEVFRHGARYPTHDIWDGKETKPFHGQLISMGMRQHYLLGTYLRKDYLN